MNENPLSRRSRPRRGAVRRVGAWAGALALLVAGGTGAVEPMKAGGVSPGGAGLAGYRFSWLNPRPQGNALTGVSFEDASNGYAVGFDGIVLRTEDGGLRWQLVAQSGPQRRDFTDVLALEPHRLLAIGTRPPGIYRSDDDGQTWTDVPNPSTGRLQDLKRLGASELSVVGERGQVLRSIDGGGTWNLLTLIGCDLVDQYWIDSSQAYAICPDRVRRTLDGGATWRRIPGVPDSNGPNRYNEVVFLDHARGFILSDFETYRTLDGGTNWARLTLPSDMTYLDASVVLGSDHLVVSTSVEGQAIFETRDAGEHWRTVLNAGLGGFNAIERLPGGAIVAVTSNGDIFRSEDDAAHWSNRIRPAFTSRNTIGAIGLGPSGIGAAGTSGTPNLQWYRTVDGGRHWLRDPGGPQIPFTSAIEFWDAQRALAAGERGEIHRTDDGGAQWTAVGFDDDSVFKNGFVGGLSLPVPGVAFVAVSVERPAPPFMRSAVYWTTNYGASWHPRDEGIPAIGSLTAIAVLSDGTGYTVGEEAGGAVRLFKTGDFGATWRRVAVDGLPASPADMVWSDPQTGVATIPLDESGHDEGIFRTTDGGATWSKVYSNAARELSFSDAQHGCATHHGLIAYGIAAVTDSGGKSWRSVHMPVSLAIDSVHAVADGCLFGGANGAIVKLTRTDKAP